jgi:hypothetical protein
MPGPVVDLLHPRVEQAVQLQQPADRIAAAHAAHAAVDGPVTAGGGGDLNEELIVHRAEEAFDLAAALGAAGGGVGQLDPEFRAGPQQPRVHERRPVIHIHPSRNTAGGQRRA